jgi:hypothetical protein
MRKCAAHKKLVIFSLTALLVLGSSLRASAWVFVADQGDTGWQTYTYTAGPNGFTGKAGFVVSNAVDSSAYSELLLDNLSRGGAGNPGFETGNLSGFELIGTSFATVTSSATAISYNIYNPTQGDFMADIQGLSDGVDTSRFRNATGQKGTVGSILETDLTLGPGEKFSFDWAFLGNDSRPWNDFALFYLKDSNSGAIVVTEGLAQIGNRPASTAAISLLLLDDSF